MTHTKKQTEKLHKNAENVHLDLQLPESAIIKYSHHAHVGCLPLKLS